MRGTQSSLVVPAICGHRSRDGGFTVSRRTATSKCSPRATTICEQRSRKVRSTDDGHEAAQCGSNMQVQDKRHVWFRVRRVQHGICYWPGVC